MRKAIILLIACFASGIDAQSQQIAQRVVVEHFTNTFCPPCASRNPGLYANIAAHPGIYHMSYHPSSPYPTCTLYLHNPPENDARTNFYSVYGSTPRVVISGAVIPSATQFTVPTLFDAALAQLTSFDVKAELSLLNSTTLQVKTTIYKVDTSSLTTADVYGVIAEDTLMFVSNNGEAAHYDVFRKAMWGANPVVSPAFPQAVGDSVSFTQDVTIDNTWDLNKVYAMVMLHSGTDMIQAAKSNDLSGTLNVANVGTQTEIMLYPNPASDYLSVSNVQTGSTVSVMNMNGAVLKQITSEPATGKVDISALSSGLYILSVQDREGVHHFKFVKE